VEERFCSHCGQENLDIEDSAFHLFIHYIQDLFHYDGKLWHTLKSLVTRPGLVAMEYMEGKRQRYLEPIRFYVFASTVFFLVFFVMIGKEPVHVIEKDETNYSKRLYHLEEEKSYLKGTPDTNFINPLINSLKVLSGDTVTGPSNATIGDVEIDLFDVSADTLAATGWLERLLKARLAAKSEELEIEHEGDEGKAANALLEEIIHMLPQLIFLSMPFFALFLKILYWRSTRKTYAEHFIFSIYHYAYLFVIMLVLIFMRSLLGKAHLDILDSVKSWLTAAIVIYPFPYLYLAMKRYYSDRKFWLTMRYLLLMFLSGGIIIMLFILIALFALIR
jgi:hypothetical protein